jgi:DNA polymerase III epsilon subunit-like protein
MKYLKSYKLFEEKTYEFGCVMVDVPVKNWNEITQFIDSDDVYTVSGNDTYGIQDRPHLTLLYGTHKEVESKQVESLLKGIKPFSIEIDGVDIFENEDYDVVKFNIKKSDILQSMFDKLSSLPNSNKFKDYKPHITIAYVKKGTGKKYIKPDYKWKVDNIDEITYSMVDGNEYKFSLNSLNESFEYTSKDGQFLKYDSEWKINENKMWYKTIPQILNWLEEKSKLPFICVDVETTGLGGPKKEQLTQVSGMVIYYDFNSNTFKEVSTFDEKIKLTPEIKTRFKQPDGGNRKVLSFNHYGSGNYKYKLESEVLDNFFNWIENYSPSLLVAQNAQFDMEMLSMRSNFKIKDEVFDTKMLIQLYFLPLIQKLAETDSKYKEMVNFIGTSPRDAGLISSSMSKIGPALGVNMSGYHDALTDIKIMMGMFMNIVDILKDNKNVDISKYQIERIKVLR